MIKRLKYYRMLNSADPFQYDFSAFSVFFLLVAISTSMIWNIIVSVSITDNDILYGKRLV